MKKQVRYPGIVDELTPRTAYASVLIGEAELRIPFPKAVFNHYHLKVGDTFDYLPQRDGQPIRTRNIVPHRKETAAELKKASENIVALFTRARNSARKTH